MKIGFVGCGNMAQAMIKGIIKSGFNKPDDIVVYDINESILKKVVKNFKVESVSGNFKLAEKSDIIFLAVKPGFYQDVISEIKPSLDSKKIIISITPNFSIKNLENYIGKNKKIVRIMPNTPAMIGCGMTAVSFNSKLTQNEKEKIKNLIRSFGMVETVPEYMMDAVVAVSGSSPAYVFMFIEAMADAAVLKGMSREQAYIFAAQAVMGAAKMVLESDKHPAELKDMVCSPSGTTIEAVRVLESKGFRSAVIEAMIACAEKSSNK